MGAMMADDLEARVAHLMELAEEAARIVAAGRAEYTKLDPATVPQWAKAYIVGLETALHANAKITTALAHMLDED
jgi:hypothetical protein